MSKFRENLKLSQLNNLSMWGKAGGIPMPHDNGSSYINSFSDEIANSSYPDRWINLAGGSSYTRKTRSEEWTLYKGLNQPIAGLIFNNDFLPLGKKEFIIRVKRSYGGNYADRIVALCGIANYGLAAGGYLFGYFCNVGVLANPAIFYGFYDLTKIGYINFKTYMNPRFYIKSGEEFYMEMVYCNGDLNMCVNGQHFKVFDKTYILGGGNYKYILSSNDVVSIVSRTQSLTRVHSIIIS